MAKIKLASILDAPLASDGGGPGTKPAVKIAVKNETPDPDYIDLKDSGNLKSGKYKREHITNLVKAAKAANVDPHQLLALVWQESNLGGSKVQWDEEKARNEKIRAAGGRVGRGSIQANLGQINSSDVNPDELSALATKSGVDGKYLEPALMLRNKLKYAKQLGFNDPALQLQAYNGYGKLKMTPGDKYYGQSYPNGGVINMRETPLYGKRLLSLSSDLKKNKEIESLINGQ